MNLTRADSRVEFNSEPSSRNQQKTISFFDLFRFAKQKELIYISIGTTCSVLIGGALPIFSMLWGNITNAFNNPNQMVDEAFSILIRYLAFGVASIFAGWGMQYFWLVAGQNQANQCRKQFLASVMRQQMGWFQTQHSSEIVSKFIADSLALQLALGEKVSLMIYIISMFVSGLVIALITGWQLALVILAFLPVLIFSWWLMELFARSRSDHEEQIFQKASGVVRQVLSSIKIVKQFNGQDYQIQRFSRLVNQLKEKSHSHNIKFALSEAFCIFCLIFCFLLSFWYGSQCVQSTSNCPQPSPNPYTGGGVLTVFFSLILPAVNLNQLAPSIKMILDGKNAAKRLFQVIDRQPLIKNIDNPIRLSSIKGVIQFRNVTFSYPKDKSRIVLKNLNISFKSKRIGVMGESGCGKSTLFQLMMRFYDPDEGVITLDGVDLKTLDLDWLRSQIGYVQQEPLLFSASIRQNLLIGKKDASTQEMALVLKQALMLDFVMELNDKLDTYVGSGGSQISGGQKQRIAIARALLKNPHILLFDEATSALDRRNQRLIQQTLSKIPNYKVSITIAHKFKTLRGSDEVFILQNGEKVRLKELSEEEQNSNISQNVQKIEQLFVIAGSNKKGDTIKQNNRIYQYQEQNFSRLQSKIQINIDQSRQNIAQQGNKQQSQIDNVYSRLFSYTQGSKLLIALGIVSSIIHGLVLPSMGIHVARIQTFQLLFFTDPSNYSAQIKKECLYMIITCFVGPLALGLQFFVFHYLGSNVVNSIRAEVYSKIVKLPLTWFQNPENHADLVPVKLGADAYMVNHVISRYFSHLCVAFSSVIFGLVFAFVFQWRIASVSIVLIPLIGVTGLIQAKMLQGYLTQTRKLYQESIHIITEAITNIKTIVSFRYQEQIIKQYSQNLKDIQEKQFKKKVFTGFVFGVSFFTMFAANGLIFYLAALFVRDYKLSITDALSSVFLIFFAGIIAGNNIKSVPDLSLLKVTAEKLFNLIDLQDQSQMFRRRGSKLLKQAIKGHIQFKNVAFKYNNREEFSLKNVSFQAQVGEKIGLIGSSGCGKSTILKLLLGFYQCQEGEIIIDGNKIQDYDVHYLRSKFGTVEQEPGLFDETVQYNIVYNQEGIRKQQVEDATRRSGLNLLQSTRDNDEGEFLRRQVGPRGSHLSGGEKQRVAIARAIIRRPTIMLLDEPTSALDKENQAKVEECLNNTMKGKTTIFVSHNLQSVKDASQILVLDQGQVIERGNYQQLMQQRGNFYRLLKGLQLI